MSIWQLTIMMLLKEEDLIEAVYLLRREVV